MDITLDPSTLTLLSMLMRVLASLVAGGIIGLDRRYQGRAAGLRTFSLVALGSCLVVAISLYPNEWEGVISADLFKVDPTRVIQGVLAGVGFLGAGVIFRDGITVRGLTTAACIWVVATIGILFGAGMYRLGALSTILTLTVLSLYFRIEAMIPAQSFKQLTVSYPRDKFPSEKALVDLLNSHGFNALDLSYHLTANGSQFKYHATLKTTNRNSMEPLCKAFCADPHVLAFELDASHD